MKQWRNRICALFLALLGIWTLFGACPGLARPQTVVIAEDVDTAGFDPALNESPWAFRPLVYNGLVELDLDFRGSPALAERWEASPDGLAWTFFLREGAIFHDGTPLTSEIVKKHFDRLREGSQKSWLSAIGDISTPDTITFVFELTTPSFIFDYHLTPPFLSVVPPSALDDEGRVTKAIGSGPFRVTSWEKGSECVLTAWEGYWGGKPSVESVVFRIIRDPDARIMAFEAGDANLVSLRGVLTAVDRLKKSDSPCLRGRDRPPRRLI